MNEKEFMECIQMLLTCDGQGKVKKDKALKKLIGFSAFMSIIIGLCLGFILGKVL